MKKIFIIPIILLFYYTVQSQSVGKFLEHNWTGFYEESSDLFEGGSYAMTYTMYHVAVNESYRSFTATMSGTINISGTSYTTIWTINGSISNDYFVSLNYNYMVSADALPDGLNWIYDSLSGTLYEDQNHIGEYVIRGNKPGSTGKFELTTYPY